MSRVLIIDDDHALCRSLELQLRMHGHEVSVAYSAAQGFALAQDSPPNLLLLDINLPDQDGLSILPDFIHHHPQTVVIIMTGEHDNRKVVAAMRNGAADYLSKPFSVEQLLQILCRVGGSPGTDALQIGEEKIASGTEPPQQLIGNHPNMIAVHKTIGLLSRRRVTVLIRGESGTGKELAARILHVASAPESPFVATNCSAVVPSLLESEFFGHEKGAFTGADKAKTGKLEHAAGGTVFLDEIGDMPLELQGKLLRVIQEEEFVPVGGLNPVRLRARIVAATNRDLEVIIKRGEFREDLYYRLSVAVVSLPPLRERRGDIPLLAEFLLRKIRWKLHSQVRSISAAALDFLAGYDWPGNVRELETP